MISMNFPKKLAKKEGVDHVLQVLTPSIANFDLYTSDCFKKKTAQMMEEVIKKSLEYNYSLSFHAVPYDDFYTDFETEEDVDKSVNAHLTMLTQIRGLLNKYGINYDTTVVYHPGSATNTVSEQEETRLNGLFFKKLSNKVDKLGLGFYILAEMLSTNHPKVATVADKYENLETMLDIAGDEKYFGFCWDMGHTRLNSVETGSQLTPSDRILDKVKFVHIHGYEAGDKVIDHINFEASEFTEREIADLYSAGYTGLFSLEYDFDFAGYKTSEEFLPEVDSIGRKITKILQTIDTTKRSAKRYTNNVQVELYTTNSSYEAGLLNLSEGGCCIRLADNTTLPQDIAIKINTQNEIINISCKKAWQTDNMAGLKFIDTNYENLLAIRKLLNR